MKKTTRIKLRKLIERIIREEQGKVTSTAVPTANIGQIFDVESGYDGEIYKVKVLDPSEYNDDLETYGFEGKLLDNTGPSNDDDGMVYVTWEHDVWRIEPSYQ